MSETNQNAEYWLRQAQDNQYSMSERLFWMKTAYDAKENEVCVLREAIIKHRSQKADDRCWLDDQELYSALGDGVEADNRVGDKAAMLKNCERFLNQRCEDGQWKSYAELEARIVELESQVEFRVGDNS